MNQGTQREDTFRVTEAMLVDPELAGLLCEQAGLEEDDFYLNLFQTENSPAEQDTLRISLTLLGSSHGSDKGPHAVYKIDLDRAFAVLEISSVASSAVGRVVELTPAFVEIIRAACSELKQI